MGEKAYCNHTTLINSKFLKPSDDVILLGIAINKKLTFSNYIDNKWYNV